jgi:hypothetical protein
MDEASLDLDLATIEPGDVAVYAGPLANRLPVAKSERFFGGCASIAYAQGRATPEQQSVLRNLGETFNLTEAHQRGVIDLLNAPQGQPALEEPGGA